MSIKSKSSANRSKDLTRGSRSEPEGRAQRDAGQSNGDGFPSSRDLPSGAVERAVVRSQLRERYGDQLPDELREEFVNEVIDDLLGGPRTEEQLVGKGGLLSHFTRRLVERSMGAELTEHLGYPVGEAPPGGAGNSRNGNTPKTLQTDHGPVDIQTPRDRNGTFEPRIVKKNQTRFAGFDEQITALYSRGMTTRDIERHLKDIYGASVGRDTISRVTAEVLKDTEEWQTRPLEQIYPILFLDALIVKIRDGRAVRNFACYLAVGVNLDGERDVLGIWFQRTEGAKFWMGVLSELKQRGVEDVLVCCVDGLTGFPEAIEAVYPQAWVQTCIVHQIRNSLRFVSYKDRRPLAADLKKIYTAIDRDHAENELEQFAEKWDTQYPMISSSWTEHWEQIVPFLVFPPDVRRVVYTTNTIESLNRQIRKTIKTRGSFPNQDSARKLLYLTITNAQENWRTTYKWSAALAAFRIHFGDRIPETAI